MNECCGNPGRKKGEQFLSIIIYKLKRLSQDKERGMREARHDVCKE